MYSKKSEHIFKVIMLVALSIFITFIGTSVFMYNKLKNEGNTKYVLVQNGEKGISSEISKLKEIIDKYYLGDINEQKLQEGALKGYVDGLGDEYSEYIPKSEYENFKANIIGNYVGIGIYMSVYKDSNEIVIVSPMKDSPAEKASLKSGDVITKVNGVEYSGDEMDTAADAIKGEAGTTVTLEIKRKEEVFTKDIVREKVTINPVTSKVIDNKIGYISLTSFDENTAISFLENYKELTGADTEISLNE